jgi:hypothetical protein
MPTLAGYFAWIRAVMGISSVYLPDDSPYVAASFAFAQEIVSEYMAEVSKTIYTDAIYNLAGHLLIETAQDQSGASFSGYISGNNLTITMLNSGVVASQQVLIATGILPATVIIGGSALDWEINPLQNYGSVSSPFSIISQYNYFANLRELWKINNFVSGVVQSTSDESTSASLAATEIMQRLNFSDLQYLKTPFGRAYLGYVARVGSPFGMS